MPINYYIVENQFTSPATFTGRIDEAMTYDTDTMILGIMNRGSTVTKADIQAVITDLIEVSLDAISKGARVNIEGFIQLFPSIEGVFNDSSDSFDPLRHKINIGSRAAEQLKKRLRTLTTMDKQPTPPIVPQIDQVIDTINGNINSTFTMTRIINVNGERLKFDNTRADEGVYIVNDTAITVTKLPSKVITISTDQKITFQGEVTATAGDLARVEVRTRFGNSLNYPLKVASSVSLTIG